MSFLSMLSSMRLDDQSPVRDLMVSPSLCFPTDAAGARWRMYNERQLAVEAAVFAPWWTMPAWDNTAPMTAAVLKQFRRRSAKQFTTDPFAKPDGPVTSYFSQFHDTDGMRHHDKQIASVKVNGMRRLVTAEDLLAEQPEQVSSELFLAAFSDAPAAFRMPLTRPLHKGRSTSIRVLVFQCDLPMVQFQPEYPA